MIYSRRNREAQENGRKKPETMEQTGKVGNKGNAWPTVAHSVIPRKA